MEQRAGLQMQWAAWRCVRQTWPHLQQHINDCWPTAQTFQTKDFTTFPDAVDALAQLPGFRERSPNSAAFAVAGPVANNRCEMTNLAWVIDGVALTHKYGIRCGRWGGTPEPSRRAWPGTAAAQPKSMVQHLAS